MNKARSCAALVTALTLTVAGCSGTEQDTEPQVPVIATTSPVDDNSDHWPRTGPGPLPDASNVAVDEGNPEAVAIAVLEIIHTRDTTQEPRSGQSLTRAVGLMTADARDALTTVDDSDVRPSMQWSDWVGRAATIAAEAELMVETHPPDEPDRWFRAFTVDEYVTSGAGDRIGQYRSVHYLEMRLETEGWRLGTLQLGDRQPTDN